MDDLDQVEVSEATGPHRVRRENNKLCFGGAALTTSLAAYRRVCLPFGVLAFRVTWIAAFLLSFASSSPATTQKNLLAGPSASADTRLLSPSSDSPKAESVTTPEPAPADQSTQLAANVQPAGVIERI